MNDITRTSKDRLSVLLERFRDPQAQTWGRSHTEAVFNEAARLKAERDDYAAKYDKWMKRALKAESSHEPPAVHPPKSVAIYDKCPFTGRPHFMDIEHPELGLVPTYGGPFDSFTIPIPDEDDERTLRSERYDHDAGDWVEGGEPLRMHVVRDDDFVKLHALQDELQNARLAYASLQALYNERAGQPPADVLHQIKRTAELSAGIMRDRERTGGWEGAERVARQFDRIAKLASSTPTKEGE